MAVFKCKMCGGTIEFEPGATVGVCDSCGTKQTLPKTDDDVIANLFNRANNLRLKAEFDRAAEIYEKIVRQDDSESEAHWGLVLCKYGIEYVEDPKTFTRIPTCHRTLFEAVTTDPDYLAAIDYSDAFQQTIYEQEARRIDRIQKDILAIVKEEKPFDVFICYKETDETGKRTVDSAVANDVYYQLTQEGLKVFYAAITLEDKLGQEYEPYIFAALNSAKVMLVIGTKPEYFNAVWVKNEWSRFLSLMKTDRSKLLIPCYRDMDAYDLPDEFSHLQAQDMGKIGFINDVVRGIKKVVNVGSTKSAAAAETVPAQPAASSAAPLLKRAFMFLEDGEWDKADDFCEQVLNLDPECAEAYLGKLMAEIHAGTKETIKDAKQPFDSSNNYKKVCRFDPALAEKLNEDLVHITERNENARLTNLYSSAVNAMHSAKKESEYKEAAKRFEAISSFKDAGALSEQCLDKAEVCRKNAIYSFAKGNMTGENTASYEKAAELFRRIPGWKDADEQILACQKRIEEINAKEDVDKLKAESIFALLLEVLKNEAQNRQYDTSLLKKDESLGLPPSLAEKRERLYALQADKRRIDDEGLRFDKQLASLGIFARNQKKELTQKIETNKNESNRLAGDIAKLRNTVFKEIEKEIKSNKTIFDYVKQDEEKLNALKQFKNTPIIITQLFDLPFYFGSYPQGKGEEETKIEWLVLDIKDKKAFVISKMALDRECFSLVNTTTEGSRSWEKSYLRDWLNHRFLDTAFNADEQSMIASTGNDNAWSNQTVDKLFLLSIDECKKYFRTDEARRCVMTEHTYEDLVRVNNSLHRTTPSIIQRDGGYECEWWLRSSYNYLSSAVVIDENGRTWDRYLGDYHAVRPAMWINLE